MKPNAQIAPPLALMLLFTACGPKVESVALDRSALTIAVGDSETLMAVIQPHNAHDQGVTWKIDNPDIAKISTDGTVTAKSLGRANVTVTTRNGGKQATCAITAIPNVSLDQKTFSMHVGDTHTLVATTNPANVREDGLLWSSSDDSVATVDDDGKVEALSGGTSTITVTAPDGGKSASCDLTVVVPVNSLTLDKTSLTLDKGSSHTLTATIHPANATNKNLSWSSSNTSVATVDDSGYVTAIGNGRATITAASDDGGRTASCKLAVALSDADWIDHAEKKCAGMVYSLRLSADIISGLSGVYGGSASNGFIRNAYAAMARIADGYNVTVGQMTRAYRMGYKGNREALVDYHRTLAHSLRDAANKYKYQKDSLAQFGVPGDLVDSVARAFTVSAEDIENKVLPEIE